MKGGHLLKIRWNGFIALLLLPICLALLSCEKRSAAGTTDLKRQSGFVFRQKPDTGIIFLSTQMNPVEEAGKMRNVILKDFPGVVDFRPNDNSFLFRQINSLLKDDPSKSILVGALHGDLVKLYEENALQPMNEIYRALEKRGLSENLIKLTRLNGKDIFYIPWMQASFVMAANKKALPYLPKGADLRTLTYEQLLQWGRSIYEKTGRKAIGFPVGEKGLMHRFFQGYLYPAFTGSTIVKFRSPEAREMWRFFKDLWQFVQPGSIAYSTMAEPLLTENVWIAWDHTARLIKAFENRPSDFVAFPAPLGIKGRGFIAIVSGMGIPAKVKAPQNPAILIDYLTQPYIQNMMLKETGFFPVVVSGGDEGSPAYLRELSRAVDDQANSRDSILTLAPIGLGERGSDYNNVFMLTFSEIVLEGGSIPTVLDSNGRELQKIIDEEKAKSWPPEVTEGRPFKIE
jgi:multiple sugar transport system substrate-binding protein